jgi:hypothetical protein
MNPVRPPELPPCIFCDSLKTRDITPHDGHEAERWYACDHCGRRFAVKFTPPFPRKQS